jgi:hydrogenase small subunit
MPGFPDKFTPFYSPPPGSKVSTTASRVLGSFIRPMRRYTNSHLNREVRWDIQHGVPSGWARERTEPGAVSDFGHRFYDSLRRRTDTGKSTAAEWGKGDKAAKG